MNSTSGTCYPCSVCGQQIWTGVYHACGGTPTYPVATGWRCPGCGSCYSPYVQKCWTCPCTTATTWKTTNLVSFS